MLYGLGLGATVTVILQGSQFLEVHDQAITYRLLKLGLCAWLQDYRSG